MINLLLAAIEPVVTTATAAAPAAAEGSNQIIEIAHQFGIKPYLLLAQIINFALVAAILYFFVIKPIQSKLDERAKLIDDGLKRSEETNQILAAANAQREQIITGARREAQALVEKAQKEIAAYEAIKRTEAQQEALELEQASIRSLALEQERQIAKAQHEITNLVVSLSEKSLEETLTPDQRSRFATRVSQVIPAAN